MGKIYVVKWEVDIASVFGSVLYRIGSLSVNVEVSCLWITHGRYIVEIYTQHGDKLLTVVEMVQVINWENTETGTMQWSLSSTQRVTDKQTHIHCPTLINPPISVLLSIP